MRVGGNNLIRPGVCMMRGSSIVFSREGGDLLLYLSGSVHLRYHLLCIRRFHGTCDLRFMVRIALGLMERRFEVGRRELSVTIWVLFLAKRSRDDVTSDVHF